MAFVIHGRLFACPAWGTGASPSVTPSATALSAAGGSAFHVTGADGIASNAVWAGDDHRLVYATTKDGPRHLYLYDFNVRKPVKLTDTAGNDSSPVFAPDDSSVAYQRDGKELRIVDLTLSVPTRLSAFLPAIIQTKPANDRLVSDKLSFERPPFDSESTPVVFSPAGDWLACVSAGRKGFRNLYLVPTTGGDPRQVSYLANAQSNSVAWATDASALFFGSGQRTEDFQLARVDLVPRTPKFRGDQFSDLFRDRPVRTFPDRTPRSPSNDDNGDDTDDEPTTRPTTPGVTTRPSELPTTVPTAPGPRRPADAGVARRQNQHRLRRHRPAIESAPGRGRRVAGLRQPRRAVRGVRRNVRRPGADLFVPGRSAVRQRHPASFDDHAGLQTVPAVCARLCRSPERCRPVCFTSKTGRSTPSRSTAEPSKTARSRPRSTSISITTK